MDIPIVPPTWKRASQTAVAVSLIAAAIAALPAGCNRSSSRKDTLPDLPCTITAICPPDGLTLGGDVITIRGTAFEDTPRVFFGSIESPQVVFISTTEITAETPGIASGGGPVDLDVENPSGEVCSVPWGFTFRIADPIADLLEPDDSMATCSNVPPMASSYDRTIHTGDEDWFCFSVVTTPSRTVTMTRDLTLAGNLDLELYDAGGMLIGSSSEILGPDVVTATGAGSYAVRVFGVCGAVGSYNITFTD